MKQKRQISVHHLLNKLKHGYDVLSLCKGLSPQFHQVLAVLVGMGVGVAGLRVAIRKGYFGWSDIPGASGQKGSSEVIYYVAGLQNLGSNCFLNVIMQGLASCSCFYPFLQNILMDGNLLLDQKAEKMPLRVALTSLLEDLCVVRDEKTVLNPRKVMLAMGNYVSSFNLTRQQDAAEAFLHLLSSLEKEVLQYYVPPDNSLADIVSLPSRFHQPIREGLSDCAQWQKHYIGPLVGTISSILACRSCSSVLSVDIESFHCLPLTPLRAEISDAVDGCTLVDCIKHFIAPEHVDNYRCGRCWHDSALKYLSSKSQKDEEKMETIRNCVKIDSCDCKSLFLAEEVMWHGFSDAVKRLRIARCPKILCIHLQRSSMSSHGDLIKLQGYISFPQVLDLFPFTEVAIEMEQQTFFENTGKQGVGPQHLLPTHMQWKMQMLSQICKISGETIVPEALLKNKMQNSFCDSRVDYPFGKSEIVPDSTKTLTGGGSSCPSRKIQYRLSSVIEHYGRPESGHYAVYRRVSSDSVGSEIPVQQWLYISDDKVSRVSEEAVFTAEASLLFYERLDEHL